MDENKKCCLFLWEHKVLCGRRGYSSTPTAPLFCSFTVTLVELWNTEEFRRVLANPRSLLHTLAMVWIALAWQPRLAFVRSGMLVLPRIRQPRGFVALTM